MPDGMCMKNPTLDIWLSVFDCIIHVKSESKYLLSILSSVYGALSVDVNESIPTLIYTVKYSATNYDEFWISRKDIEEIQAGDIGEFIFFFEKDMTIELQRIRSDLYFIHAAVVQYQGKAVVIVAPSGTGKSTTSWALLHEGFRYISDELAPIDLRNMHVLPYPHALCLKDTPPVYLLPDTTLRTDRTMHVPVDVLPGGFVNKSVSLVAIFFLQRDPNAESSIIRSTGKGLSATKIYANSLNVLAHPFKGLDAAISIASKVSCFDLIASNSLKDTCANIIHTLDSL